MTNAAVGAGRNMANGLSGGNAAIVATGTGADDKIVIHPSHSRKTKRRMTRFALIARRDMTRRFACRTNTIVAANAALTDAAVTKADQRPSSSAMAIVANEITGR